LLKAAAANISINLPEGVKLIHGDFRAEKERALGDLCRNMHKLAVLNTLSNVLYYATGSFVKILGN
jgi:hypothetical protein